MEPSLLILSALAGAIHVLAPDHWMPLSLASWQRRWRSGKTLAVSLLALLLHLGAGFVLYVAVHPFLLMINGKWLFSFAAGLVLVCAVIRALRFSRIRDVLRLGPNRAWTVFTVLSLLGPCESLIPIMIKAHHLGVGYLSAFAAFAAGTLVTGLTVIAISRLAWNQPLRLTRGIGWAHQRRSVLPVVIGVTAGLIFLLRL